MSAENMQKLLLQRFIAHASIDLDPKNARQLWLECLLQNYITSSIELAYRGLHNHVLHRNEPAQHWLSRFFLSIWRDTNV